MANNKILATQDGGWVQLPPDSTGKRIGHLLVDEVQSDGSTQTAYFPMMTLTDADGNIADIRPVGGYPTLSVIDRRNQHLQEKILNALMFLIAVMLRTNLDSVSGMLDRMDGDMTFSGDKDY